MSALFCCQSFSKFFHRNRLGLKENLSIPDRFSWPGPRPRPQWPLQGQQPVILSIVNKISAFLIALEESDPTVCTRNLGVEQRRA